jgi:hypothetical protein
MYFKVSKTNRILIKRGFDYNYKKKTQVVKVIIFAILRTRATTSRMARKKQSSYTSFNVLKLSRNPNLQTLLTQNYNQNEAEDGKSLSL